MFDGIFSMTEALTQDFGLSQPLSQADDKGFGSSGPAQERELGKGVLHATCSTLLNLLKTEDAYAEANIKVFGTEWAATILVGWILDVDDSEEGVWLGQICDGTGTVQFRYEKASNMPESYETRLRRLLPVSGNNENKDPERPVPEFQMPVRMIGTPTKTGEGLLFAASHLKQATADEVVSSHFLECALTCLAADHEQSEISSPPLKSAVKDVGGVDPYFGEEIDIPEDVAPFVGGPSNRIKRVIWRYLMEASKKEFNADKSESCVAVRSFCSKLWKDHEVNAALDALEDDGVIFYLDAAKGRVSLA